ncbi:hypothetical protein [Mesorhizobium sp. 10J20-29]
MDTKRLDDQNHSDLDAQIATLLDRLNESASIVDQLMAMPLPKQDGLSHSADWDAVVARRMETRLASALRSLLEEEPTAKRA